MRARHRKWFILGVVGRWRFVYFRERLIILNDHRSGTVPYLQELFSHCLRIFVPACSDPWARAFERPCAADSGIEPGPLSPWMVVIGPWPVCGLRAYWPLTESGTVAVNWELWNSFRSYACRRMIRLRGVSWHMRIGCSGGDLALPGHSHSQHFLSAWLL